MAEVNHLNKLVIGDFTGGMTDYFLGGKINKAQLVDNFYLNENEDLITRPGSEAKYDNRVESTNTIRSIIDHDDNILIQAATKVKYVTADGADPDSLEDVNEIQSPQSHSVFTRGSNTSKKDFAFWNKHTIGVSDAFTSPQKIYKDQAGDWQVTTLGLPEMEFSIASSLANELRTNFNAHIADLTQHALADADNTITAAAASDVQSLIALTNALTTSYTAHLADALLGSAWDYHIAQGTDYSLESTETVTSVSQALTRLIDLQDKFNDHDADAVAHTLGGVHPATAATETTATAGAGAHNYIYALHFSYRYMAEDTEFLERGRVMFVEASLVHAVGPGQSITINDIPALASGTYENWDDSNIKIQIYRTLNNGSTFYFVTEINNGDTNYSDELTDALLEDETRLLYTDGGILDDDQPPPAKYIVVVNDIGYFGHIKEGSITRGNRLRSTKPGVISSSPEGNILDFEDDIVGQGFVGIYPIIFLKNKTYRVEGFFDSFGRGGMVKRDISQKVGCVSHKSIVVTKSGIYFASDDGFYFTDGFSVKKMSTDINETYETIINKGLICGAFYKSSDWITWAAKTDSNETDNHRIFVAHLDRFTEYEGHPFTTWSGGTFSDNFSASALAYIDGEFLRADHRGYILRHDKDLQEDPQIDTTKDVADWGTQTIIYDYRSCALDFGDENIRKWVSKIVINADNESSLGLQISSNNDNSGVFADLTPIAKKGNVEWGDPTIIWNETDLRWNYFPVISEWRWMPAVRQNLRCSYKQVRFTNAYVEIDNSEFAGPCEIDATTKEITLISSPTNDWLDDAVNYYISFEYDDYANEYLITDKATGILTVSDNNNDLTDQASTGWRIKGYKKREILNLLNYVLNFQFVTQTQDTVRNR